MSVVAFVTCEQASRASAGLPLKKPATLYLATSADGGLEELMPRLTNALADGPAAPRAFRALFKPGG